MHKPEVASHSIVFNIGAGFRRLDRLVSFPTEGAEEAVLTRSLQGIL